MAKAEEATASGVYTVEVEGQSLCVVKVGDGGDISQLTTAVPAASAPVPGCPARRRRHPVTARRWRSSIWKVIATEGQSVAEGDVLLILGNRRRWKPKSRRANGTVRGIAVKVRGRGLRRRHPDDAGVRDEERNGSLNALLQGMGLMHLGAGGHHAAGQPAAAVAGDGSSSRYCCCRLASAVCSPASRKRGADRAGKPAGMRRRAAGGDCRGLTARRTCTPLKNTALALPSVQSQMENLAVDMGAHTPVLALFYKVAIGSGVAPLVIFAGVGAMTDFGPLLANPALLLGRRRDSASSPPCWGADAELLRLISFTLPQAAAHRHYRRRGRPDGDLPVTGKLAPGLLGTASRWRIARIWRWCR